MKSLFFHLVLATLCLALPVLALATTYFVDPSGSDSNPGTTEQPFKTVAHAADIVTAGDTVLVNPGTYTGEVKVMHSGTREHPIIFVSVKRHGAVVPASFTEEHFDWGGTGGPIHYVTVKGIAFAYPPSVPGG
jgi:hypothetical protein